MAESIETPIQFVQKLKDSVQEYKKKSIDTRDDSDAAYFFNPALKTFLKKHKNELDILSTLNFEKSFMTWMKTYLLKETSNDRTM